LEVLHMKTARLNTVHDGGPMVERLQEEIKDYKSILKCSVCHDRPKEVLYYFLVH
jgi:E3 ubiquitin-protein ligase BRE1